MDREQEVREKLPEMVDENAKMLSTQTKHFRAFVRKKNTYLDGAWKTYIDFMEEKHTQILSLKLLNSMM